MKKMGFGIIGCGMIAGFHAKAIAAAGGELIGCYDKLPLAAERIAKENGGTPYQNLGELLADPAIDIVTIGTPSGAHMDPAVMAAEAGKHVIVEKPLEVTLERCDKIIAACDKPCDALDHLPESVSSSSTQLKKRSNPPFRKTDVGRRHRQMVSDAGILDSGHWRGTGRSMAVGRDESGNHSVDLLLWLMGPVAELTAMTGLLAHERIEVEDTAVASLRFKNGALERSRRRPPLTPLPETDEIHGNTGSPPLRKKILSSGISPSRKTKMPRFASRWPENFRAAAARPTRRPSVINRTPNSLPT